MAIEHSFKVPALSEDAVSKLHLVQTLRGRPFRVEHTNETEYTVVIEQNEPVQQSEIKKVITEMAALEGRVTVRETSLARVKELKKKPVKTIEERLEYLEIINEEDMSRKELQ